MSLRGRCEYVHRSVANFCCSEELCFHFNEDLPSWVHTNELKKESLMKTTVLLLATILVSQLSHAHSLTEGSYTGNGLWHSAKETGTYKTDVVVEKAEIKTKYQLLNGALKEWNFKIKDSSNGFFEVLSQGVQLGNGYCLEKAPVCHYQFSVGKLKLEETITQQGNKLYRFGSKDEGHGVIFWQESLTLEQVK